MNINPSKLSNYGLVVALVAALAYGVAWYNRPPAVTETVAVEARPAPEVKHETRAPVAVKRGLVQAYKPAMKANLKLPDAVQSNDAQVVVASSRIDADERPMTVTAVTNTETGETTQYVKAEALPWLAVNTKTEVGVFGGLKGGEMAVRVSARQELLQIKALHVGAIASADMTRSMGVDTFIGVGIWARW